VTSENTTSARQWHVCVLSSAADVATQRRADRRQRVYDFPTAARSLQVSGHVVLLDAQSACPSADR